MARKAGNPGAACAPSTPEEAGAAFRANYLLFQYEFVEFFADHLSDMSRVFGGDLQAVLVLAVIGQVRLRSYIAGGNEGDGSPAGISASRLSDVTGIPRETVRRKLKDLEAKRWIERVGPSLWRIRMEGEKSAARQELNALDNRAIDRIARMFCRLQRIASENAPST